MSAVLFTYDGIVVGHREIGENSYFLDILTDEQGIIEATAHGAKKLNSSIQSSSSLFAYSTFCLKKNKLRYSVNSAKPKYSFHELGQDIVKLSLASYFAQVVRFCTPEEQEQHDSVVRFFAIALFELQNARRHVPASLAEITPPLSETEQAKRSIFAVRSAFELRYACILGYRPDLTACCNCGCYEHEQMFFLPDRGELVCGDCFDRDYGGESEELLPETLSAMRNIVFAPLDRCFRISLSPLAESRLSYITERYLLRRTERSFGALSYFKSLI